MAENIIFFICNRVWLMEIYKIQQVNRSGTLSVVYTKITLGLYFVFTSKSEKLCLKKKNNLKICRNCKVFITFGLLVTFCWTVNDWSTCDVLYT